MGELTTVIDRCDLQEVTLHLTGRADAQLAAMDPLMRELAEGALHAFLGRLDQYLSREIEHVSFIGRTREAVFILTFEVFGPTRVTVHDINYDFAPIEEGVGFFRLERAGRVRLFPVGPRDPVRAELLDPFDPLAEGIGLRLEGASSRLPRTVGVSRVPSYDLPSADLYGQDASRALIVAELVGAVVAALAPARAVRARPGAAPDLLACLQRAHSCDPDPQDVLTQLTLMRSSTLRMGKTVVLSHRILGNDYRMSFGRLYEFVAGNNKADTARTMLFGSRPPENDAIWEIAKRAGFEVVTHDRNVANKEKNIDTGFVAALTRDAYQNAKPGDIFAIVSGANDYVPAVQQLREIVSKSMWSSGIMLGNNCTTLRRTSSRLMPTSTTYMFRAAVGGILIDWM